jgi:uncharacterized repeat protein (TIGR03847 family)
VPRRIHSFDPPERFVAGTVGQPGNRTFYLQARGGGRVVSVGLEKAQMAVLADRLGELLAELARRGVRVPPAPPPDDLDTGPLDMPVEEEFRIAAIALAWDSATGTVIVEAQAPSAGGNTDALSDAEDGPDVIRVRMSPAAARAFADRALRVVAAGRPPCPLCGLPLDPEGHVCPRQNGHRPAG